MLKKSASGVLSSSKSSTYPRGYASGFDSPAALLDDLFEHPTGVYSYNPRRAEQWNSSVRPELFSSCWILWGRSPLRTQK